MSGGRRVKNKGVLGYKSEQGIKKEKKTGPKGRRTEDERANRE